MSCLLYEDDKRLPIKNIYRHNHQMTGFMRHALKGIDGWSELQKRHIDVSKIIEVSYRKRLFCILDRQYP